MKPSSALFAASALFLSMPLSAADLLATAETAGTFKTFLAAAKASGFAEKLKESGPYTVFAPGDSAFNKLPAGTLTSLIQDKPRLTAILSRHVIPGNVTINEVKPGPVATLNGDEVKLTSDNGKVTVNEANVIQSDLMADNGVIHEIDTVILPGE